MASLQGAASFKPRYTYIERPYVMHTLVVVSVLILAPCSLGLSSLCDLSDADLRLGGWKVVVDENFAGGELNASLWTGRYSNYTAGHENEAQSYVPGNARIQDGKLVISTKKEKFLNKNYTSAWIDTSGKFEALYGRFCVRANLPGKQPGFWPAHWLMPGRGHEKLCWPGPGEVDIMEMINGDGVVHGSLHYNAMFPETHQCSSPHMSTTGVLPYLSLDQYNTTFHEYAIEWSSESLTYYVDGVKYVSTYPNDRDKDGVPQVPMYIIINSALGGGWAGPPNQDTHFPILHTVDYVRVLQSSGEGKSRAHFTGTTGVDEQAFAPFTQRQADVLHDRAAKRAQ
ncbi:beta-glucanase-like [Sycon ciliatum]|uniref:beta-glucanase-like n=1 Tax=Sycon ciliatum TaxID=27933 RepID=UPI0020ADF9BF|eukprot:scpid87362/ scgid6756/ Beta-glucanase; 1,3-1,4-beta-D-glucan 4-glucanohydrolase; Endo-beta-1,3-1,4 glucanase; Lichenase